MKNRRIMVITKTAVFTFFCAALLVGCNKDDDASGVNNEAYTEMDAIVNSEEFAALQKAFKADRKMFSVSYKSLSKVEKKEYARLQEIGKNLTGKEKVDIARQLSELLKIDFDERNRTLSEAMFNCFNNKHISKLDLAKAIRRRNIMTRSSEEEYKELQYMNCIDECEYVYTIETGYCYEQFVETVYSTYPGGGLVYDVIYHEGYDECMSNAYYDRIDCLAVCEYIL